MGKKDRKSRFVERRFSFGEADNVCSSENLEVGCAGNPLPEQPDLCLQPADSANSFKFQTSANSFKFQTSADTFESERINKALGNSDDPDEFFLPPMSNFGLPSNPNHELSSQSDVESDSEELPFSKTPVARAKIIADSATPSEIKIPSPFRRSRRKQSTSSATTPKSQQVSEMVDTDAINFPTAPSSGGARLSKSAPPARHNSKKKIIQTSPASTGFTKCMGKNKAHQQPPATLSGGAELKTNSNAKPAIPTSLLSLSLKKMSVSDRGNTPAFDGWVVIDDQSPLNKPTIVQKRGVSAWIGDGDISVLVSEDKLMPEGKRGRVIKEEKVEESWNMFSLV
ncbi:hypothetical protein HK096_010981, partial [Nowakowskiella sp. JEL0078]